MEEMFEQSANTVEVAEPQIEEVETQETSENTSEVADPKPVQDAETNAHYAEMRRNQEINEYRQKLQEMEKYQQFVSRLGEQYGFSPDDYMQEVIRQQQAQKFEEAGITEEAFNNLLSEHPDIQFAREMKAKQQEEERFKQEANELFSEFPDLKPDQIPAEVWQLKEQRGIPLLEAYLRVSYKSLAQQKEQEAIQKLQQNAQSTPGALGAGAEHKTNVSDMSKSDFQSLVERVKRGETIQF